MKRDRRQLNLKVPNKTPGADGVKIAVLRKGRTGLKIIWAAAHWHYALMKFEASTKNPIGGKF